MNENNKIMQIGEKQISELLNSKKENIISLIGRDNFLRELSFAVQACNNNSLLQQADPVSVAQCVWNVAITGLTLNPVQKLAYLTPRWDNKKKCQVAVLTPSYQGLTKLVTDTGAVTKIHAYVIFKGDEYDIEYGTTPKITHKPKFVSREIIAAYAVATLPDGSNMIEVMDAMDLQKIKESSDGYKAFKDGKVSSAIWETWENEMSRKAPIKRLTKYVPKTDKEKWESISQAIDLDNKQFSIDDSYEDKLLSLVNTSSYNEDTKQILESKIRSGLSSDEAAQIHNELMNNQLDRISSGMNYNQGDIKNHIQTINPEPKDNDELETIQS